MQPYLLSDLKDFVIRKEVFQQLQVIYDEVQRKGLRLVLLEGPFGSGKTTIVEQFASKIDCHFLRVYGIRHTVPEPYLPFKMLLDLSSQEKGYEKLVVGKELRYAERSLIDRIKAFLQMLAKEKVVVLFVDDANYLDDSSITMLIYIRYALEKEKLMIICAYRSEEESSFKNVLPRLLSDHRTTHIVLNRLSYDEVRKILRDELKYNFPEDTLKKIYEASGGQPYFLNELLNKLLELNLIDKERRILTSDTLLGDIKIPTTITSVILHKLNNLSACCRKLLSFASIFGMSFRFEDLIEVSGIGECALDALEEAIRAGILTENQHKYEFTSFQAMKIIYDSIITERRKEMHLKVAEFLRNKGADVYSLAIHYYYGGDFEKAKEYLLEAIRESQRLGSYSESINFIRMLKSLGFENSEIRYREGFAYCTLGDYSKGIELLLSVPRDSEFYVDAILVGASVLESRGERSVAASMLLELLENTSYDIKVASKLITTLSRLGYLDKAKKVLDLIKMPVSNIDRYFYEKAHAIYNAYAGNDLVALQHFAKCREYIENVENMEIEKIRSYSNLGAIYSSVGDIRNSEKYYRKSLELSEKVGYIEGILYSYMNWGDSLRFYGQLDMSQNIIDKATQLSKAFGHWDVYSGSKLINAWILLEKGLYKSSLEIVDEILRESSKSLNDAYVYSECWFVSAYSSLCLGNEKWSDHMKNAIEAQPQRIKRIFWNELLKFELGTVNNNYLVEYYKMLPTFEKIMHSFFVVRYCAYVERLDLMEEILDYLSKYSELPRVKIALRLISELKNHNNKECEKILREHNLNFYADLLRLKGLLDR